MYTCLSMCEHTYELMFSYESFKYFSVSYLSSSLILAALVFNPFLGPLINPHNPSLHFTDI